MTDKNQGERWQDVCTLNNCDRTERLRIIGRGWLYRTWMEGLHECGVALVFIPDLVAPPDG